MVGQTAWAVATVVGGGAVLLSYVAGSAAAKRSLLLVGWSTQTQRLWAICAVLTAAAFLYIQGLVLWDVDSKHRTAWLFGTHMVFLGSAAQWMGLSIAALHDRRVLPWVVGNLWTTGVASVVYTAALATTADNAADGVAVLCGFVLIVQHVIWDACIWSRDFRLVVGTPVTVMGL